MRYKLWFVIFVIIISATLAGCLDKAKDFDKNILDCLDKAKDTTYWACMDGCSNMQEIFKEKYGIEILKEDHDACAEICWQQYGEDV